jgi:hypothetical protein
MTGATPAYREIAWRVLDQCRYGSERNHRMNKLDFKDRLFDTSFVIRVIFLVAGLAILVSGNQARADGLFTKAILTCHFDHGGEWNYDVSPPKLGRRSVIHRALAAPAISLAP